MVQVGESLKTYACLCQGDGPLLHPHLSVRRLLPGPGDRGPKRRAAARGDGLSVAVRRPLGDWPHLVPLLPRDQADQLQPVRRQRVRRPGGHVPDAARSQVTYTSL